MQYTFSGRYSDNLESLLDELGAVKELRVDFEDDWSGYVDVDVLLYDGRVFSYKYWYGSCSGCDDWENRDLSDDEIQEEMRTGATLFDDEQQYNKWRDMVKKDER